MKWTVSGSFKEMAIFRTIMGFSCIVFAILSLPAAGAIGAVHGAPRLELVSRESGVTRLQVLEVSGTNVNLQWSVDLQNWFTSGSATVQAGQAALAHTNNEPFSTIFYRAADAPPVREINIGPAVDAARITGGLITPEDGGELEVLDGNGVTFTFRVPANAVSEPVLVRMTPVSSFSNLPLENRHRAAVVFEPSGLGFRSPAELTIRFPGEVPSLEFVAYGFETSGDAFPLRPWNPGTNEVRIPVLHFSGAGVAAQSFTPAGEAALNLELAIGSTREAVQAIDNFEALKTRVRTRELNEGKITRERFDQLAQASLWTRNLQYYNVALKPLLAAAQRDCEIGEYVLNELDKLETMAATPEFPYGQNDYYKDIASLGPQVRCHCVRQYLEECERNAASTAADKVMRLLANVSRMTRTSGAQGCNLGTDAQILDRLARAACFKPWEGTVHYSKVIVNEWRMDSGGGGSSLAQVHSAHEEVGYYGRVVGLIERDGGSNWASWILKVSGRLSGNYSENDVIRSVTPEWTVTDLSFEKGSREFATAEGDLYLRFDNGAFTSATASAGLSGVDYVVPLQTSSERQVECRKPQCPAPSPMQVRNSGSREASFAKILDHRNALVKHTFTNGALTIEFTETISEPNPVLNGEHRTVERVTIQLRRNSAE